MGKKSATEVDGLKRRLTVYLPSEVAKKLAHRCVDLDRDTSDAVTEAVRLWLAERGTK